MTSARWVDVLQVPRQGVARSWSVTARRVSAAERAETLARRAVPPQMLRRRGNDVGGATGCYAADGLSSSREKSVADVSAGSNVANA